MRFEVELTDRISVSLPAIRDARVVAELRRLRASGRPLVRTAREPHRPGCFVVEWTPEAWALIGSAVVGSLIPDSVA